MSVTLRQIAERSGVSVQTVSRILGGHVERFRPETRERVERVARELNYQPDPVGRALVGGRTMSLGVLTHGIGGRVEMVRLQAMLEAAHAAGYETYVRTTGRGAGDTERLLQAVRRMLARRVDGLIISRTTPISDEARRFFASLAIPAVFIHRGPPRYKARIRLNAQPAIDELAAHLATLGHQRAAMFASLGSADFLEHKVHPYQRAFARAGVELAVIFEQPSRTNDDHDAYRAINTEQRSYEAVRRYLSEGGAATALCMNNDEATVGALAALREKGLSMPEDVSVAGFDDLGTCQFCEPTLTTIRTPRGEVGRSAFEMLERLMHRPDAVDEPVTFAHQLITRASTGPAPRSAAHRVAF